MISLKELIAQRDALSLQIQELSQTQRTEAIEQVRALMQDHALTVADLRGSRKASTKPHASTGKKVAAKYRDQTGNSWSGRGMKPRWLQAAVDSGKKIEEFAV